MEWILRPRDSSLCEAQSAWGRDTSKSDFCVKKSQLFARDRAGTDPRLPPLIVGQTFENLDVPRFPITERKAEEEESENHSKISGAKNICHLIISPRLFPLASRLLLIRELVSFSKAAFSTQFRKGKMDAIFSTFWLQDKKTEVEHRSTWERKVLGGRFPVLFYEALRDTVREFHFCSQILCHVYFHILIEEFRCFSWFCLAC